MWQARLPDPRDIPLGEPVHDGDSLFLCVDRGGNDRSVWPLRLKGVFAPELQHLGGPIARDYLVSIIRAATGPWPFEVETFKTSGNRDLMSFERFIATITINGDSVNDRMTAFLALHPEWGGGTGS
jgi:hypothetical protein